MPPFSPGANAVTKMSGSAATAVKGAAARARAARAKARAQRSVVIGETPRRGGDAASGLHLRAASGGVAVDPSQFRPAPAACQSPGPFGQEKVRKRMPFSQGERGV